MVICFMSFPVVASAAETPDKTSTFEDLYFGNVDILINEDLGLMVVTTECNEDGTPLNSAVETQFLTPNSVETIPEKEVTTSFSHNIYDRNNALMATIISTVKGVYSQVDSTAEMISISASISGPYASYFTYSTSISGADGYLYVYYNGSQVGTFHYRIYTTGSISNI